MHAVSLLRSRLKEKVQLFIMWFAVVPVIIAAVTGLVRLRQLDRPQRYLLGLTLFALSMEIASHALAYFKRPNLFLAPIDTAVEFGFLAFIYRRALAPSMVSRLIPALVGLFVLGSALTYSPHFDTAQFNPVQRVVESVLALGFVALFFRREIARRVVTARLEYEPMLWVSTGLLLYFSGNILIFLSSNYVLNHSRAMSLTVWSIHAMLYIFLNILYTVALCSTPRPRPAPPGPDFTQS